MPGRRMHSTDELLSQLGWIRSLARTLTADPNLGEDLAQSTCVAALENRQSSRGWLRVVLRNFLRQHARRENDRRRREALAASDEAVPATDELVARARMHRRVVEAVLALPEPYREVVLLRYFEGMTPAEIAQRLDVTANTVYSQLQRAHRQLRTRLSSEQSGGLHWLASIAAERPQPATSLATSGALFMKAKLSILVLLVVCSAIVAWAMIDRSAPGDVHEAGELASGTTDRTETAVRSGKTIRETPDEQPSIARSKDEVRKRRVVGVVLGDSGRPLPNVSLQASPGGLRTRSDENGVFEIAPSDTTLLVRVADAAWVTTLVARIGPGHTSHVRPVVIAAPRISIAGTVVDASGAPVQRAALRFGLPADFAARLEVSLDASAPGYRDWQTSTDANGRFEIPAIGAVRGGRLVCRKNNYLPRALDLPRTSRQDLRFVLRRPAPDGDAVRGQVLDTFGNPVWGAVVCLGRDRTTSDVNGRFHLSRAKSQRISRLVAMKRGHLPVEQDVPPREGDASPFVYLRLGPEPLRITGRVMDARRRPVAGARVWAADASVFPGGSLAHVEGYLAGGMTPSELRSTHTKAGRLTRPLSELREHVPTSLWGWVRTDRSGVFVLGGLRDRDYRVRVMLVDGYRTVEAGPFRAGARGVEIRFAPETFPRVAGRVVGRDGSAISGVAVEINCRTMRARVDKPNGKYVSSSAVLHGKRVRTDEDGRFDFGPYGKHGVFLSVNGEQILDRNVGLHAASLDEAGSGPASDLRIEVARRLHFRIQLADPNRADAFRVLDGLGETLPVSTFEAGGKHTRERWPVHGGRTRVLAVSEDATTLVLQKGGDEVARVSLRLAAGRVNVVRP